MKIIVVGLGLIGGSFCKAIKEHTEHHVIGVDSDENTLDLAISMEAVDEVIPVNRLDLLSRGDLVIAAIPPKMIVDFLLENKDNFKNGAIVTDVCGVKEYIVNNVAEPLKAAGVEFIGSHPMAGTEYSGFTFSKSDMFVNASYLVTPTENTDRDKLKTLKQLAYDIGFKAVLETTAKHHDESIAYTSQLAHIVSNSYIRSATLPKEKGFSAGSFLDMTRVARLDADMWCDLFLLNRENLLFEIDQLISHLEEHREALIDKDRDKMRRMLRKGHMLKIQNVAEKRTLHD
ncbi:MAG: prephenate dehydrogenase [Clostridia bacterium]|nr:prephenate dehydrogenase [Bacillota bacterium]MCI8980700.1 prephenate dehydrogenase [Clostridia bacterium]